MSLQGPVYLRWRAGRPRPEEERFDTLDAALDVVEARWAALRHQAPQVLDARRVLLFSTAELTGMWEEAEDAAAAEGDA